MIKFRHDNHGWVYWEEPGPVKYTGSGRTVRSHYFLQLTWDHLGKLTILSELGDQMCESPKNWDVAL